MYINKIGGSKIIKHDYESMNRKEISQQFSVGEKRYRLKFEIYDLPGHCLSLSQFNYSLLQKHRQLQIKMLYLKLFHLVVASVVCTFLVPTKLMHSYGQIACDFCTEY